MNELTMSQESSVTSNPPVSLPSAGKSLEFQPTVEGYERLLEILRAELPESTPEKFRGGKYVEIDQKCQMCSPLSLDGFSHRRNEHTVSSVTSLPSKHRLRQLLSYAISTRLQARVSFREKCPAYRSLIIGDLPPLSDSDRIDLECDTHRFLFSQEGEASDAAQPVQTAKPKDTRRQALHRYITDHHIGLVNDSLVGLKLDIAMQDRNQPTFEHVNWSQLHEWIKAGVTLDESHLNFQNYEGDSVMVDPDQTVEERLLTGLEEARQKEQRLEVEE